MRREGGGGVLTLPLQGFPSLLKVSSAMSSTLLPLQPLGEAHDMPDVIDSLDVRSQRTKRILNSYNKKKKLRM